MRRVLAFPPFQESVVEPNRRIVVSGGPRSHINLLMALHALFYNELKNFPNRLGLVVIRKVLSDLRRKGKVVLVGIPINVVHLDIATHTLKKFLRR